jgi:hypothetical protein
VFNRLGGLSRKMAIRVKLAARERGTAIHTKLMNYKAPSEPERAVLRTGLELE